MWPIISTINSKALLAVLGQLPAMKVCFFLSDTWTSDIWSVSPCCHGPITPTSTHPPTTHTQFPFLPMFYQIQVQHCRQWEERPLLTILFTSSLCNICIKCPLLGGYQLLYFLLILICNRENASQTPTINIRWYFKFLSQGEKCLLCSSSDIINVK